MLALRWRRIYSSQRRILVLFLVVLTTVLVPGIHKVSAAGLLYVSPPSITAMRVGSTFTVQVKVSGMDSFDGWDISVVSGPTVINATSLVITGNILAANTTGTVKEIAHCINTNTANGCRQSDGPGVVESAVRDIGSSAIAPSSGRLFNITYQVVGTGPYSPISIPLGTDEVRNGSSSVKHTDRPCSYGAQVSPDFAVTSKYPLVTVFPGYSNNSQIMVTSLQGFTGIVNLTAGSPSDNITTVLNPTQVMIPPNGEVSTILNITASSVAAPSAYPSIKLIGVSGKLSHSTDISITVQARPDFVISANPDELFTHAEGSNSTTVIVKSENGFSGTVNLIVDHPTAAKASLSRSSLTIAKDGQADAILNITTQSSLVRFRDRFNVTGTFKGASTSLSLSYTVQVIAEPPPPDFGLSTNPVSASVLAGESKLLTIQMTSLDYFEGTNYLFGTSKSGVRFSFSPNSFYLNIRQTVFATLILITDSAQLGDQFITITALSGLTRHSVNVTLTLTSTPQSAPLRILGLQPVVFFGLIAGLAALIAVIGVWAARKPSINQRPAFAN